MAEAIYGRPPGGQPNLCENDLNGAWTSTPISAWTFTLALMMLILILILLLILILIVIVFSPPNLALTLTSRAARISCKEAKCALVVSMAAEAAALTAWASA